MSIFKKCQRHFLQNLTAYENISTRVRDSFDMVHSVCAAWIVSGPVGSAEAHLKEIVLFQNRPAARFDQVRAQRLLFVRLVDDVVRHHVRTTSANILDHVTVEGASPPFQPNLHVIQWVMFDFISISDPSCLHLSKSMAAKWFSASGTVVDTGTSPLAGQLGLGVTALLL